MPPDATAALHLWVVLNRAVHSVEEHLRRQVEAHGLNPTEFAVLEVLLSKGTLAIGEVGDRVLRASGSMTYVVDKLERRGLLRRRACPTDRRIIFGELTPQGRELIERVFAEHAALLADLCGGLTPAEQDQAADLVKRLGRHAMEYRASSARAA